MEEKEYNPIQDYPSPLKDKIKEWYLLREKVGREKTFGDLVQRQENLEALESQNIAKLENLQRTIEVQAVTAGVQFDSQTGEVTIDNNQASQKQASVQTIDETKDELSKVSGEYAQVTKALYGEHIEANKDETKEATQTSNPGVRTMVSERKQELMTRDAKAKKLLDAKVKLEAAKDRMDMHGAKHVAQKYRLMMRMEQAKLELIRRVALGAAAGDMSIEILKQEIQGLANQMQDLEATFENSRASYAAEFGAARNELENSQKEVELESKSANLNNKYSRNLTYSDEGILNGSTIDGVKSGRTIHEQELYDERGVMIFDIADVLSREKSINIDGLVVTCVTEFGAGTNVEDSFYVGEMEALEVNTDGGMAVVEEKPDIGEELDNDEAGKPTSINTFNRVDDAVVSYMAGGMNYPPDMLYLVPEEQRAAVRMGLVALGLNESSRTMNTASLAVLACEQIGRSAVETSREVGRELNLFEEREFKPSDN